MRIPSSLFHLYPSPSASSYCRDLSEPSSRSSARSRAALVRPRRPTQASTARPHLSAASRQAGTRRPPARHCPQSRGGAPVFDFEGRGTGYALPCAQHVLRTGCLHSSSLSLTLARCCCARTIVRQFAHPWACRSRPAACKPKKAPCMVPAQPLNHAADQPPAANPPCAALLLSASKRQRSNLQVLRSPAGPLRCKITARATRHTALSLPEVAPYVAPVIRRTATLLDHPGRRGSELMRPQEC
jgi:hypothetical protein